NFNVLDAEKNPTSIIPLVLGNRGVVFTFYEKLLKEHNIFTSPVVYPAVPKDQGRLRIIINSEHTKKQMDKLINSLKIIKKENLQFQLDNLM
ncbi:unnamed protein product, partial [marine sediment metagenome]